MRSRALPEGQRNPRTRRGNGGRRLAQGAGDPRRRRKVRQGRRHRGLGVTRGPGVVDVVQARPRARTDGRAAADAHGVVRPARQRHSLTGATRHGPSMPITTDVELPAVHPFSGMDVNTALAERVARFGERRFLVWSGRGDATTWTYREFAEEVERVAAGLTERGVEPGDAVLLLLENSPAFLFCWFACARLGAVAIDTNTRYAADELHHALQLTGAVGAITHEHY